SARLITPAEKWPSMYLTPSYQASELCWSREGLSSQRMGVPRPGPSPIFQSLPCSGIWFAGAPAGRAAHTLIICEKKSEVASEMPKVSVCSKPTILEVEYET